MFAPCFLQNSCNSPRTRERTHVPVVTQNFFKSFGFTADPLNYALRIAPYEVVFARVRAHIGEASLYLFLHIPQIFQNIFLLMSEVLQLFFPNNFSSNHWHLTQLRQQRILIWLQPAVSEGLQFHISGLQLGLWK
jgi:hypothetical protein